MTASFRPTLLVALILILAGAGPVRGQFSDEAPAMVTHQFEASMFLRLKVDADLRVEVDGPVSVWDRRFVERRKVPAGPLPRVTGCPGIELVLEVAGAEPFAAHCFSLVPHHPMDGGSVAPAPSFPMILATRLPYDPALARVTVRQNRILLPAMGKDAAPAVQHLPAAALLLQPRAQKTSGLAQDSVYTQFHELHTPLDPEQQINFVFLAEGYVKEQEGNFLIDAEEAMDALLEQEPFAYFSDRLNVYAIFVESNESGTDIPERGVEKDTYFNSSIPSVAGRSIRIPTDETGSGKILDLVETYVPQFHLAGLIVNEDSILAGIGGARGSFMIIFTSRRSDEAFLHEMGHSFGELVDTYECCNQQYTGWEAPNATQETRREHIRWTEWIADDTPLPTPESPATYDYFPHVGLFQGAFYGSDNGWYRPKDGCKMKGLGADFCEVCSEQLTQKVYSLIPLTAGAAPDPEAAITLEDHEAPLDLSVDVLPSSPPTIPPFDYERPPLMVRWQMDGEEIERLAGAATATFSEGDFPTNGTYAITATVADEHITAFAPLNEDGSPPELPLIREEAYLPYFSESYTWTVNVQYATRTAVDSEEVPVALAVEGAYPNPFSQRTTVRFTLRERSPVTLRVYDVTGRQVATLAQSTTYGPGTHEVAWDATALPAGVYLLRLDAHATGASEQAVALRVR